MLATLGTALGVILLTAIVGLIIGLAIVGIGIMLGLG